jgi:hypothetical protein
MGTSRGGGLTCARRRFQEYLPAPEEIARACAEIRAGWSAKERADRWQGPKRVRWEFPQVALSDVYGGRADDVDAS